MFHKAKELSVCESVTPVSQLGSGNIDADFSIAEDRHKKIDDETRLRLCDSLYPKKD